MAGVAGRRRRLAAPALRDGSGAVVPARLLAPPTLLLVHLINMWGPSGSAPGRPAKLDY